MKEHLPPAKALDETAWEMAHKIAASPKVTVKMARRVLRHLSEPGVRSSMNDELIYQTFINKLDDERLLLRGDDVARICVVLD